MSGKPGEVSTPGAAGGRPRLRKQLGQHHLRTPELCRPLIEFLQPFGRATIEVGSGGGVLTRALVDAEAKVVAMDLDLAWLSSGRQRFRSAAVADPVRWLAADATRFGWQAVGAEWLVAGNLPYNAATPIVRAILERSRAPRMGFLVQKEVAERMTAGPGSRRYGLLSLVVGWWAEARVLGVVKPGSFNPPPKVESRFIGLSRRSDIGSEDEYGRVLQVAELAFTHRRKTLANALRSRFDRSTVADWCVDAGLPVDARPEQLSLDHYRSLASALLASSASSSA